MSFLDNIRDRISQGRNDDYYDDQDYDDGYYDDEPEQEPEPTRTGLLGNSRRPEPESVSVYTRSGRPVGASPASAPQPSYGSAGGYRPEERRPAPVATRTTRSYDDDEYDAPEPYDRRPSSYAGQSSYVDHDSRLGGSGNATPGDIGGRVTARPSGSKLPPYVLKPAAYDDVQMVVRRVRTNQPVVLVFRNTNIEAAKRILDFSFGLACGVNGAVQELGDRVFVVLPAGCELSQADIDKLVADGDLVR